MLGFAAGFGEVAGDSRGAFGGTIGSDHAQPELLGPDLRSQPGQLMVRGDPRARLPPHRGRR